MQDTLTVRWVVSGRVQGVGFRWFVVSRAQALDLAGWVKNLPDGRVEVVARGHPAPLGALEASISRGPVGANVESVEKSDVQHQVSFGKMFAIK